MPVRKQQAYTLVELLIALSLLSVIMLLLFASLQIISSGWRRGEAAVTALNGRTIAYQFLKQHLSNIRPLSLNPKTTKAVSSPIGFEGEEDGLEFVAPAPEAVIGKGLYRYAIRYQGQDSGLVTVDLQAQGEFDKPQQAILLEQVTRLRFSYLGIKSDGSGDWQDDWQHQKHLPALIRLEYQTRNRAELLPMVFALKIIKPAADGR